MKIFAVYFSGTGNTKYAVERFLRGFDGSWAHSIEEPLDFRRAAEDFDTILVAYPIYGSDMPLLMRDFLKTNKQLFAGKNMITLVTQFLFSGDGGRLAYRLVRKDAGRLLASMHIPMPANINMPPIMSIKNGLEIEPKIEKANRKIDRCAECLRQGRSVHNGWGPFSFLAGFLGQRLWYQLFFVSHYRKKLRVNPARCIRCGLCVKTCPVDNLTLGDVTVETQNTCILCYRCVNQCPVQAITLMSKHDSLAQYKGPDGNG